MKKGKKKENKVPRKTVPGPAGFVERARDYTRRHNAAVAWLSTLNYSVDYIWPIETHVFPFRFKYTYVHERIDPSHMNKQEVQGKPFLRAASTGFRVGNAHLGN